jgi:hypothetical protein
MMGRQNKPTIPQAWHQTKLAIKKNIRMPTRGAEGILVLLEALASKCGLNLEEVIEAAASPSPVVSETVAAVVILVPPDATVESETTTVTEEIDATGLSLHAKIRELTDHGVSGPVIHALSEASIETIGDLKDALLENGNLSRKVTGVGKRTEDSLRELFSDLTITD